MQDVAYWSGWKLNRPMDNPGTGDSSRAHQRALTRYRDESEALELLAATFPDLAAGKPNVRLDDPALVPLFDRLLEQRTGKSLHRQHNFLVRGLVRGSRELGWDLSIPAPMTIVPKELPPVTPEGFERLAFFDRIVAAHLSSGLAQRINNQEPAWAWGQFLFCLLAEGPLLNRQWLKALPDALTRGVGHHSDHVYLTLCRAPSDKADNDNPIYRRVFLGPLASLVLLRNYSAFGQHWPTGLTLDTCLRHYCRSLSAPGDTLPRSLLSHLLDACASTASLDYPPFLVHYAKQSDLAVSLPPETWHRLSTKKLKRAGTEQYGSSTGNGPALGSLTLPQTSGARPDQGQRLRLLQACFTNLPRSGKGRKLAVTRRINDFFDATQSNSPILHLLAHWCLHMINHGGRVKKRLATGTIKTYLSRIAAPLVIHAGTFDNLAQLTEEDWQALYEAVLAESRGHNNRLQRARQLVGFHSFVSSHYAVPLVHLEYGGQSQRHVDANLLTPAEYQRTLDILADSTHSPRAQRMLTLALTLGYRCGLRRDEVASLLLRDIQGLNEAALDEPELIVRPNADFTGKSVSAKRRLPLRLLLTVIEQQELTGWLVQRRSEANTGNSLQQLLFCALGEPSRKLGDAELFQPIQLAMRTASGDVELRFHHLRHSFVSFTLLRILEQTPEQLLPRAWAEDDQQNIALPNWKMDFSRAAQLAPADQTTRKRLWALSLWAGHAGPHETLASYAHLVDWILGRYTWLRHDPVLSNPIQAALLNRSEKSLSVWRHRNGLKGGSKASQVSRLLMKQWKPYTDRLIETEEWASYIPPRPQAFQTLSQHSLYDELTAMGIYSVLRSIEQAQARGEALDDTLARIEEHHHIPRDIVRGWLTQGNYLMSLQTSRGMSRFSRKKSQQKTNIFTNKGNPDLSMCIAPPTSPKEQRQANGFFQKILDLLARDPERYRPAIAAWAASMQRSKGQVVLSECNMQTVLPLYRALGLTPHLRLSVEIDQTISPTAAQNYWVQSLGIDTQLVQIKQRTSNQPTRAPHGRASLRLAYNNQSGAAATQLLPTLRFALFVSLLVRPVALATPEADA